MSSSRFGRLGRLVDKGKLKTVAEATAVGAAGTAASGTVVSAVLGSVGFSSIGPVAGSTAAAFQSAYGTVCGFSTLQSVAMAGISGGTSVVIGLGTVGVYYGVKKGYAYYSNSKNSENPRKRESKSTQT